MFDNTFILNTQIEMLKQQIKMLELENKKLLFENIKLKKKNNVNITNKSPKYIEEEFVVIN